MKLKICLLLCMSFTGYASSSFVTIYKNHDNGLFGRSVNRDITLSLHQTVFRRRDTLQVEPDRDYLTAVVLSSEVKERLDRSLGSKGIHRAGFIKIYKKGDIYTLEDDNIMLKLSFSLEKAAEEQIQMIVQHYKDKAPWGDIVSRHYRENYVIRIHEAENVIRPEAREITYDEAVLAATIIGDRDQWLWGIHDGSNYLVESGLLSL